MIPDPSNPQAWNRYSYVGNNPVNFNDPSGHDWVCTGANNDHCYDDGNGTISGMVRDLGKNKSDKGEKDENENIDKDACTSSKDYCEDGFLKISVEPVDSGVVVDGYVTPSMTQTMSMIFILSPDEVHNLINNLNTGCQDCSSYWEFALSQTDPLGLVLGEIPYVGDIYSGSSIGNTANMQTIARQLDNLTYSNTTTSSSAIKIITPVTREDVTFASPTRTLETLYEIKGSGYSTAITTGAGNYLIKAIVYSIQNH